MINMTLLEEDSKDYITDIIEKDNGIEVTYGDDHKKFDDNNSLHNINCYRVRMMEQVKRYMHDFEIHLGKEFIFNQIKKYLFLIIDIAAIYFNVNMNPNTLLKIITTILLIGGELFYFFMRKLDDMLIDQDCEELNTLEFYVDNNHLFEYYSKKEQEFKYVIPIEYLSRYKLGKEDLIRIRDVILQYKDENKSLDDMSLSLKPNGNVL